MSCSPFDLKDYFFEALNRDERRAVDQHIAACAACRDEFAALHTTRGALLSLADEEPPRRTAFVSDKVFEPNWWQKLWTSGPRLGFASACLLAGAIVFHGAQTTRVAAVAPAPQTAAARTPAPAPLDEERIAAAVAKAVAAGEERQAARLLEVVNARLKQNERDHRADLVAVQDYVLRMHKEAALVRRTAFYPAGVTQ